MTRLERLETEALKYAQIPSLPEPLDDGTPVWIYAIARIANQRGSESFVIVRNEYGSPPAIVKAFDMDGFAGWRDIYPYKFLDRSILPPVANVHELRKFLAAKYDVPMRKVNGLNKDDLLKLTYNYCIRYQVARDRQENARISAVEANRAERALMKEQNTIEEYE